MMLNFSNNQSVHTDLDVLVIGGGISGLTTAWFLAQQGLRVQVWEKSSRAGGKIKTDRTQGFQTEQAASIVMNFKPEVDQFFHDSGLYHFKTQRSLTANSKHYLIHKGQLKALPMTISGLFFSSLWSYSGKFRLMMEPFIGKGQKNDESVSEFVTRRFGKEFLEKAMEPFIAGTLASDPDLASAQHVIPRLTALEKRFGSITSGMIAHKVMGKRTARHPEKFSFQGGMQTLTQQLADDSSLGFHANMNVLSIVKHGPQHWEVQAQTPFGEWTRTCKHVVISSPADNAAQLIAPVNSRLSELLSGIQYAPLSVVHIGLARSSVRHPLDSVGFLVPRQEKMAINGSLWMSSLFSGRAPYDNILLSSYLGGSRHPSAINLSGDSSINRVLSDIRPLLGISAHASPIMGKVDKHQKALPLYHSGYHQRLTQIEKQLQLISGLHLEANYKGGVSVRDRIISARNAASRIIQQLALQDKACHRPAYVASLIEKPA